MSKTIFVPAMMIAGLSMAFVVIFSNWLMQGGAPLDDGGTLPQAFAWLNMATGQDPIYGLFIYGQFTFPIAFLITDIINRLFGPSRAWIIIAVGAVFGGAASYFFATPLIALASVTAFVVGQVLDVLVFQRLRQLRWYVAPLASSLLASLFDTVIFYAIAFGILGSLGYMSVDFGVKVLVALIALLPFRLLIAALIGDRQGA